jgi:polysaccharide biosynthesis protein VpsQ
LIIGALVFSLFIIAVIISANTDSLPFQVRRLYNFPGGDKAGHFILFGFLSLLLNKSAPILFPGRNPTRLILTVSLLLALLIGLEEWSQSLFPARTMSFSDLVASYAGVFTFALLASRTKQ